MPANNDLFDLIKTLSKSERRYFRMSASLNSRSRVNRYVRLFDMVDAQEVYNEDAVREEFTERFGSKHFAEAKYYLYNAILRALHAYSIDRSADAQLTMALHQAELLYERKLYRQCIKLLERTRQQALLNERWHHAAEAAKLEIRLRKFNGTADTDVLDQLFAETECTGDAWIDELRHWVRCSRLEHHATVAGLPRDQAQLDEYWNLLHEHGSGQPATPRTATAAYYYLNARSMCHLAGMEFREALASHLSILRILESGTSALGAEHSTHVLALMNVCVVSIHAGDTACFLDHYPRLVELSEKSPESIHYGHHIHALALLPHFHASMGDFERARVELVAVERAMERYGTWHGMGLESTIGRLSLGIHFGLGDYAGCIEHLNALLALRSEGLPSHYYAHMRLIQIIVHFERGDYDLLESLLRSARRFFLSIRAGHAWERSVLEALRKALNSSTEAEHRALLSELFAELAPQRNGPFGLIFQETVDIPMWIESRLGHRSYAELTREHFLQKAGRLPERVAVPA